MPVPPPSISTTSHEPLTKFDLDFSGGTAVEFVAAIGKAMGKHVNVIIPDRDVDVRIMPVSVRGVTVAELFQAVGAASVQEISVGSSQPPLSKRRVYVQFTPSTEPVTDSTVWSFVSTGMDDLKETEAKAASQPAPPPKVTRYFQLGPYLWNHTIEDITTAIQTGWKMAGVDPTPELSFHKETNLLIAVGPQAQVDQIPEVLKAIAGDNSFALRGVMEIQAQIAKLEEEKKPGWENEVERLNQRIRTIAAEKQAMKTLENPPLPPRNIHTRTSTQ